MTTLHQASREWSTRSADERFTSLTALHAYTSEQRKNSEQFVLNTTELNAIVVEDDPMGIAFNVAGKEATFSHWSFGQVAALAKAPPEYLRTLPGALAADNINYGLRFNRSVDACGGLIRHTADGFMALGALTGPSYGRIWNAQVVSELANRFGDGVTGDWKVPGEFGKDVPITKANTTLFASDRDMFVFLADEKNKLEISRPGRHGALAVKSPMSQGFFVKNSEVGKEVLEITTFLFDYVCANRIVWGASDVKSIRLRHSKFAPGRFIDNVTPVLANLSQTMLPVQDKIQAAQDRKIDDVAEFLKRRKFSANMLPKLQRVHTEQEGRPIETLWDVTTALTAYAQTIPYQDERVALETEAGLVLNMA